MNEIYNEQYYRQYDVDTGKIDYIESKEIKAFHENVAEQIVNALHPRTVLDAGCASGHLVAALRDRGVEAYGIDISEYAISMVREDVREYCAVCSLTDPLPEKLPEKFDLVISIEVLEHLSAEDGCRAIANLCARTDRVIFSSTPDDFEDPTHINVQPREYWAKVFAGQGFLDDLNYRPTYIAKYASSFRRSGDWLSQLEDYERLIVREAEKQEQLLCYWEKVTEDKERHIQNLTALLTEKENRVRSLELSLKESSETAAVLELHYREAIGQRDYYLNQYTLLLNSRSWKLTKPLRSFTAKLKTFIRAHRCTRLAAKGVKSLLRNGFTATWQRVRRKLSGKPNFIDIPRPLYTENQLKAQKKEQFPQNIKFSILVPLYNTPEKYLREMIQSVLDQTYSNWELCLADGSDQAHGDVGRICAQYARKDKRIRYKKLEKNLGISGNTNACIDMAAGDYISLFDHDDLLHPAALYENMKAICEKNADFIYTDENTFRLTPSDAYCPHFKPDYAPDTLRANNYICHFTTFKRSLLDAAGKFRPECDGSQDFDMMLRLTEKAEKIVHIPKILYYWRAHPDSVAESVGAKPYVIEAAKRGIRDHLERVGLKGEVLDSAVPSMYRLRYEIEGEPLVSIIIPNYEHKDDLKVCLESIYDRSTYRNFEVIIVENNSASPEIFAYYQEIREKWPNLRVVTWDGPFNYSAINNFGAKYAAGEHLLLLNNDTEVISPDWIQEMLMYSQRSDVGAVGAKLYYSDDTVQHAGLGIGLLTLAGHYHRGFDRKHPGYMGRLIYAQDLSGVTFACVMIPRKVWDEMDGLDESFAVAFNDVDMCMRIRKAGYLIVWTPFAELYHYESKSRGQDDSPEKRARFVGEVKRFQTRWAAELEAGDPYYNPNFSLDKEDFSQK